MTKTLVLFAQLSLALLLATSVSPVRAESGGEAAIKTAFLYNFFKFIEWPEAAAHQDTYHLCTADNDNLGDNLLILENKTVNNKPLIIHRNINGEELKTCQMVFIGPSENTASIVRGLKGLPILTVSDKPNFIDQGGMIGLVMDDNRLGFEINLNAANIGGIHVSAQLLKLAKNVISAK
jgi:hypothetical protein